MSNTRPSSFLIKGGAFNIEKQHPGGLLEPDKNENLDMWFSDVFPGIAGLQLPETLDGMNKGQKYYFSPATSADSSTPSLGTRELAYQSAVFVLDIYQWDS